MKNYFKALLEKADFVLPIFIMSIFMILTLKFGILDNRICWEDESHAWIIAKNTNIFQLIDLMKVEGHFLLWYLCLMPFAKINLAYPYPMLLLNWLFTVISLFIMWYKAPFSKILKICITFSAPFFFLYSSQARCYSIGILFLFLAMTVYKNRISKPYQYLTYLTLAANTSFPACIAAGILGLLFVYDLVKSKVNRKIFYVIFTTVILNLILFYFQFHGVTVPDYEVAIEKNYLLEAFLGAVSVEPSILLYKIILLRIGIIIFSIFLFSSKRAFIFFLSSSLINLLFFLYVYNARIHHICMIFIFAIIAYWIHRIECQKPWKRDWFNIFFITVILQFVFIYISIPIGEKGFAKIILEDSNLRNAKIYTNLTPIALAPSLPYLENENIYIYDIAGRNLASYEGLKTYFSKKDKTYTVDMLARNIELDKNKNIYVLLTIEPKDNFINGEKYQIKLKKYATATISKEGMILKFFIYKVIGINNHPEDKEFIFPISYQQVSKRIFKEDINHSVEKLPNNLESYIIRISTEAEKTILIK